MKLPLGGECYKQVTTQLPVIITGSYDKLIAT